jgi:hypothetical protein
MIMSNYYSYSHINSPSHDVSLTIHFGSLVFEHQGDFNLKLTGIDDPDLTRTGCEVFTSFSQIPDDRTNSTAHLDLDYDDSDEEVEIDPYESHNVYMATWDNTQATTKAGSSASRPSPCLSNAPTLNTIPAQTMMESALRPRNLNSDFRATQEDNIQIRTLLETMGALAQEGTPLATVIKQAQDLVDQAKQRLDAKAAAPSKSARSQSRNRNAHPQRSNRSVGNRYNAPLGGRDLRPKLDTNQRSRDA